MNKKVITFLSIIISLVAQNAKSNIDNSFDLKIYDLEKQIILMQTDGEDRKLLLKAFSTNYISDLTSDEKNNLMEVLEKVKNRLKVESTPYIME